MIFSSTAGRLRDDPSEASSSESSSFLLCENSLSEGFVAGNLLLATKSSLST